MHCVDELQGRIGGERPRRARPMRPIMRSSFRELHHLLAHYSNKFLLSLNYCAKEVPEKETAAKRFQVRNCIME